MMLVPDEELGSPQSRGWIEDGCRDADAVLVLEAHASERRRGDGPASGRLDQGGLHRPLGACRHQPAEGLSAVRAAARATLALEALSDVARHRVVNVGILRGGTARQVVPTRRRLHIDIRAALPEMSKARGEGEGRACRHGRRAGERQGGRRLDAARLSRVLERRCTRTPSATPGNRRTDRPGGVERWFGRQLPGLDGQAHASTKPDRSATTPAAAASGS